MNRTHACLSLLVLVSCSKTHQDDGSTETGNPPVIERGLVALVVLDGQAHVVGEPGAIEPADGEVEVTIERTDDVQRGPIEDDGSFDVEVDARLGDAFSLRVIVAGEASTRVRFTNDAGAAEPIDGGPVEIDSGYFPIDAGETCVSCLGEEIAWRRIDPDGEFPELPGLRYAIEGCDTLVVRSDQGEKCTTRVEQCGPGMGMPTIDALKPLLALEAVRSAFEAGGQHGEPDGTTSFMYELSLGDQVIEYRSCHVGGDVDLPCTANPALESLVLALTHLDDSYFCALAPDCDSPWDPGQGEATAFWYWHDPDLRACVPMRGNEQGGDNGNRYESVQACWEACPEPAGQPECGAERVWSEDGCFECGFAGGCLYTQSFCPLPCETDEDCARDNTDLTQIELVCRDQICSFTFVVPCL